MSRILNAPGAAAGAAAPAAGAIASSQCSSNRRIVMLLHLPLTDRVGMSEIMPGRPRTSSGIAGLDAILGGGFPPQRLYLIQGNPGSGKTTLGMQFLLAGLEQGEPGLYITLSESSEEVSEMATSHGWTLDGLERITLDSVDSLISGDARTTVFHPSEVELDAVAGLITDTVERCRPMRAVFDSLSEFRLLAESALRYRHQLLEMKRRFAALGITVLLLDDMSPRAGMHDPHVLSLAHGVVNLRHLEPEYGVPRRQLQATKLRAARVQEGYHDFTIETGGLSVYPRLRTPDQPTDFQPMPIPSGNDRLDSLLGGGIDRGTTTLLMGSAGTGKSSLALLYASQMAERGETVMFYTFDESLRDRPRPRPRARHGPRPPHRRRSCRRRPAGPGGAVAGRVRRPDPARRAGWRRHGDRRQPERVPELHAR